MPLETEIPTSQEEITEAENLKKFEKDLTNEAQDFLLTKEVNTTTKLFKDSVAMHNSEKADDYHFIRKTEAFVSSIEKNEDIKHKEDRIERYKKQLQEIISRYNEDTGIVRNAKSILAKLEKII